MPWYTYLFFLLASLSLFFGGASNANAKNMAGMIFTLLVVSFWGALALWTGGFLS